MSVTILNGDCRNLLPGLPEKSVQCCVTSPPYWGLRDYGHADQIGQEKTPDEFIDSLLCVFRGVWKVLKDDGTLWLNLGDSYNGYMANQRGTGLETERQQSRKYVEPGFGLRTKDLKPKDLCGIPWRVAFALQADGWYLRSDIIWAKPNCMPESVTDRPTRSHEYIFLMTKNAKYYYDHEAIREACVYPDDLRRPYAPGQIDERGNGHDRRAENPMRKTEKQRGHSRRHDGFNDRWDKMEKEEQCAGTRNKRDVWTVAPANYPDSHFATFPPDLIRPCILAGSKPGDTVLDPFGGSGTVGEVALEYGRNAILMELNPEYIPLIEKRTNVTKGLPL
jgi:DNA modification methylase